MLQCSWMSTNCEISSCVTFIFPCHFMLLMSKYPSYYIFSNPKKTILTFQSQSCGPTFVTVLS
jgi:hypothetical protein